MANDDVIQIQREIADKYRAEAMAKKERMKKDIRSQIARSGWYNPDNDPAYVFVEYPKYVRDASGKELGIARNQDEELALLGKKIEAAKAVSVDLAKIAGPQIQQPAKRKYTRKSQAAPLPAPLE